MLISYSVINKLFIFMKKEIHPKYFNKAKVTCTCGNVFEVGSTSETLDIELCSKCHPFYSGKQKLIDDSGVINRYQNRLKKNVSASKERKGKKVKKVAAKAKKATKAKK